MNPSRKYLRNRQVEYLARNGDDQVFNRMLTCWIDDSEEQDYGCSPRILT